jgi:hypothetical protein
MRERYRMKKLITLSLTVFCCICLVVATESRAFAYVNPGDGLLALQSIAAAGAAVSYFMRRRIALLFGGSSEKAVAAKKPVAGVAMSVPAAEKEDTRNAA